MSDKAISARLVQKHDLEVNWLKAVNFAPKQGELIVYDIEVDSDGNVLELPADRTVPYTYARFKVGDGFTLVSDLAFAVVQPDFNQNDPTQADYVKNRTHYLQDTILSEKDSVLYGSDAKTTATPPDMSIGFMDGRNIYVEENACLVMRLNDVEFILPYEELADETGMFNTAPRVIGKYNNIDVSVDFLLRHRKTGLIVPRLTFASLPDEDINIHWTYKQVFIKTLDSIFIPDTIARVSDFYTKDESDAKYMTGADWEQTDEAQLDYIKNKPSIATDDEVMELLFSRSIVTPVSDSTGYTYLDVDQKILVI
jgi:hypothetical protein